LVGCVRLENMLGGTEVVRQAAERGLLSRPWYMGGGLEPWDPRSYRPPHHRPRLFLPYYEECKSLYSERSGSLSSDTSSFNFHRISEIPDTLYMVRDDRPLLRTDPDLPDQDNVSQMVRRVRKLYRSISVQRALVSPFANRQQIFLQLQLRVVREYNLPDSFSSVLQRAMEGGAGTPDTQDDDIHAYSREWDSRRRHASLHYLPNQTERVFLADLPLSDAIPDIAMASSSMGSLTLSRSVPSPRGGLEPRISPRPPSLQDCGKRSPDVVEGAASLVTSGSRYSERVPLTDAVSRFSTSPSRYDDSLTGSRYSDEGSRSTVQYSSDMSGSTRYSPRSSSTVQHSYRHGPSHMFL